MEEGEKILKVKEFVVTYLDDKIEKVVGVLDYKLKQINLIENSKYVGFILFSAIKSVSFGKEVGSIPEYEFW